MSFRKYFLLLLSLALLATVATAQEDRTKGGIKGKVGVESGQPSGVTVSVRQGENEIAKTTTDRKGTFRMEGLAPGRYTVTFQKTGLSTGTLTNVEVRAGKVRDLGDKLIMAVDEGALALLRGSVFDPAGRSVRGARIELARLAADGTARKIDGRLTNESGQFVFRLTPEAATYRVTVKADGAETTFKDVPIDGPAIYRVALSLKPAAK